jgi:hypothetical protein
MYAHYSTFAGGATAYTLNTSDQTAVDINGDPAIDLSVDPATGETQAVIRVDIEIPADEDSYCFRSSFDQHSKYGTEMGCAHSNGKKCYLKPVPIYIAEGDLTPHVLVVNERLGTGNVTHDPGPPPPATPNPHKHTMTPFKFVPPPPAIAVDDGLKFEIVQPSDTYNCLAASQWNASVKLKAAAKAGNKLSAKICGTKFADVITVYKVEFLDKDKNETTRLKVAKWENAFENTPPTLKANFVDLDPDRFYVRVNDQSKKGAGTISIKLSTDSPGTDYDDDATELDLAETAANSGIFESKSLIMVSDDTDDDHQIDGIADDVKNDRSHKVALGGKAKIVYPASTPICEKEADVKKDGSVSVSIVILRNMKEADGGANVISVATVESFWKIVRERYAQLGVDITWSGPVIKDPPSGVDLSDGLLVVESSAPKKIAAETKTLIDAYGTKGDRTDIHVFYANDVKGWGSAQGGIALADYWFDESEEDYLDNILLDDSTSSPWGGYAAAHELTHITTDTDHPTALTWRLMHGAVLRTTGVTGSRRLTVSEETTIKGNSHVQ